MLSDLLKSLLSPEPCPDHARGFTYRARVILDLGEELREVWRERSHRSSRACKSFPIFPLFLLLLSSEKIKLTFFFRFAGKKLVFFSFDSTSFFSSFSRRRRLTMPQYIPREDDEDVLAPRVMVRTESQKEGDRRQNTAALGLLLGRPRLRRRRSNSGLAFFRLRRWKKSFPPSACYLVRAKASKYFRSRLTVICEARNGEY